MFTQPVTYTIRYDEKTGDTTLMLYYKFSRWTDIR